MQNTVDSIFSLLKSLEELAYPEAKILPGIGRFLQFDEFSCGLRSLQSVLAYYDIQHSEQTLKRELRTTREGTDVSDILRVLRGYGLRASVHRKMGLREIKEAIDVGCPIIVTLYSGWHWSVCYGHSKNHLFVMNPSVNFLSMGSLFCAVSKKHFRKIFDRYGIVVMPGK